ncbi:hypothetical protein GXW82_07480 [Streptacidiphilus sp. 4-A2]|nr:hypothetical protein [Streptacidiphilus sp. 4-A2]
MSVGVRVVPGSPSVCSGKPVAARTCSTSAPGCTVSSRMVCPGPPKSSTARSVTTRRSRWKRVAAAPALAALSWPTPLTTSTRSVKVRGVCLGTQ